MNNRFTRWLSGPVRETLTRWREWSLDAADKLSPWARDIERAEALRQAGPHDPDRDLRELADRAGVARPRGGAGLDPEGWEHDPALFEAPGHEAGQ